jgi:hypothetical protein
MSSASAGSEPVDGANSLAGHAANGFQLRLVAALCVAYAGRLGAASVRRGRPDATAAYRGHLRHRGPRRRHLTFVLVSAQFRARGARWLLALGSAYLFSGRARSSGGRDIER